jgi:hypothetical protein
MLLPRHLAFRRPQAAGDKEKAVREAAAALEAVSRELAELRKARDEVRVEEGVMGAVRGGAGFLAGSHAVCRGLQGNSLPFARPAHPPHLPPSRENRIQATNRRKEAWRAVDDLTEQYRAAESEHGRAREVRRAAVVPAATWQPTSGFPPVPRAFFTHTPYVP